MHGKRRSGTMQAHRCRSNAVAKTSVLGIRLTPTNRVALERAAKAEVRTLSAMAQVAIADWLRRGGWLKKEEKGAQQ